MEKTDKQFPEYRQYLKKHQNSVETALREYLPNAPVHFENEFAEKLKDEKERFYVILTMLGAELVDGKAEDVLPSAVAVEYIALSSKILENIKFADNLQNDKVELMVGLSFLNAAYPLVFVNHSGMPERALAAHAEIVECVGASGLVGSLIDDAENVQTSALIRLALRLGAILSGANYLELANLSRFAELIGDNFYANNGFNNLEEAKRVLIENFPSNEARSCLIQLTESLSEK